MVGTLTEKVQVNIPFRMLRESYVDRFIAQKLNPEVGLDADALDHYTLRDFSEIAHRIHENGLTVTSMRLLWTFPQALQMPK